MAKVIYVCFREGSANKAGKKLHEICKRLEPDNITPPAPVIYTNSDVAYGIMNPPKSLEVKGKSLLMGQLYGEYGNWDKPLNEFPDGSYALFRDGKDYCEIVSDPVASRTIWYYLSEKEFIASTSQRAIVMFLGSFEFDDRIIPWMLSNGTLGPAFSWDRRINRVPPDSSIILDKKNWSLSGRDNKAEFKPVKRQDKEHEAMLRSSIAETFKNLNPDYTRWALPLSGGYDSRGILCFLKETGVDLNQLRTITWGLKSSLNVKRNDAAVAGKLACRFNVSNKYYENDLTDEPLDRIIERFILQGEGRIADISDYLDGFRMWKNIFEDGIEGIIRGDENFGCKPYSSTMAVRINQGCTFCTDLDNLKDYRKYGFPSQELPEHLKKKKDETLSVWRDTLFYSVALPTEFSALSDLKFSYVEQINPLLSKRILQQVRELPDRLRTGKVLFKKIVDSLSPDVEYAKSQSSKNLGDILKQEDLANLLKEELSSACARSLFPAEFLDFVSNGILVKSKTANRLTGNGSLRKLAGVVTPRYLKEAFRDKVIMHSVDPNILAFRTTLIIRMNKILNIDMEIHKDNVKQKLEGEAA